MALIPMTALARLKLSQGLRKAKKKTIPPSLTPKSSEVKYRRDLLKLTARLSLDVRTQIIPLLRSLEPQYTRDGYAETLEQAFINLQAQYRGTEVYAKAIASELVSDVDEKNRKRFYKSLESSIGINMETVIQNENLSGIVTGSIRQNVALIKSIPEQYFKDLEVIVFQETSRKSSATSMIEQIQKLNGSTVKRARTIARDQTSKVNAAINQQRQQNLGITQYVWRTSADGKVRETHAAHNGKVFDWDDPPKGTGHPGDDPNCRCIAQAIIDI